MSRWNAPSDLDYAEQVEGPIGSSSDGREHRRVLVCACGWSGDFTDAVQHFRLTEHVLTYRGTVQNLEVYRVTAQELESRR